jgi:hypothetical protein
MDNSCTVQYIVTNPALWFLISIIVLFGFFAFLIFRDFRGQKNLTFKALGVILWIGSFIISAVMSLVVFWFLIGDDSPPSRDYHTINAAIKNTCYLDPQRNHCPKTIEDIIAIDPEHFKEWTKDANLTYQYYPETNEYTLIIRNNHYNERNRSRVAIFDPRLSKPENLLYTHYGGRDFVDTEIMSCNGKLLLVDPPPFPGPWDNIN